MKYNTHLFDIDEILNIICKFFPYYGLCDLRLNQKLNKFINNQIFLTEKANIIYDSIFEIINIITEIYDKSLDFGITKLYNGHIVYGTSNLNTKKGIIIQSNNNSFISDIYTPNGAIQLSVCSYKKNNTRLLDYLQMHITMIKITELDANDTNFYIVTHINGKLIDHDIISLYHSFDLMWFDNISRKLNYHFVKFQYNKQFERENRKKRDSNSIISRFI